ncbi:MAG: DMT family transporter [Halovenus sp.]
MLLAVLFGGSFVAIKMGLRELPPLLFASFRFDIGAAVLGGYVVVIRARSAWLPRTRNDILGIAIAGVFLVALNNALLFVGQGSTTPAMASIMYGLNPVLAPVFAWWLLGDRLSRTGALGIGVALAGVIVIVQPSPAVLASDGTVGQFLVLGAATAVAVGSVLLKRFHPQMGRLPLTAWAMAVGALLLHGLSLAGGEPQASITGAGPLTVASLLVVGIPSTAVAYAVHFGLLERIGPVRANLVAYVVPITAALAGWLFLQAGLSVVTVVGFLVVVTGFGLVERQTLQREVCHLRRWQRRQQGAEPTPDGGQQWPCDD